MCDLVRAAGLAVTVAETTLDSGKAEDGCLTIQMSEEAAEQLKFALYEVERRAEELKAAWYEAEGAHFPNSSRLRVDSCFASFTR